MEESQLTPDPAGGKTPIKRVLLPVVIILSIVVIALLAIKASVHREAKINSQLVELTEGADVPNFELTRLDGSKVYLNDLPHKIIMINFWASWCEACIEEMPSIVALREKYAPNGFEIFGVDVDENPASAVPPVVNKFGMKFPIFTDKDGALAELFDVHAIPLTIIINKSKKILFVESGERDWGSTEVHQMMDKWITE